MRKPECPGTTMAKKTAGGDNSSGGGNVGAAASAAKLRKGLWSPEEDERLVAYMLRSGQGSWSDVARNAGLQRCGKSCRLRWINYLRPDLKRGAFSPQEEDLIVNLHAILGNRWSQIAARLPGRTDNEIKNFWNSTIKKRLKNSASSSPATTECASPPEPKLTLDGAGDGLDLSGLDVDGHHAMKSGVWMDSSSSSSSSSSMQSRPTIAAAARSYGGLLLPLPDQVCGVAAAAAADTPATLFFHDHASFKQAAATLHGCSSYYYGSSAHHGISMEGGGGGSFIGEVGSGGVNSALFNVPPLLEPIAAVEEEDHQTIMASSGNDSNPRNNSSDNTTLSSSNITDVDNNIINLVSNNVACWEGHQQHMSRNVMGEWDLEELMKDVSSLPFLDFQVE